MEDSSLSSTKPHVATPRRKEASPALIVEVEKERNAIAAARRAELADDQLGPADLQVLVLALATAWLSGAPELDTPGDTDRKAQRSAVVTAVAAITAPSDEPSAR